MPTPQLSADQQKAIYSIVKNSPIHDHSWTGRGLAPLGYTEGVAVCFAHCLRDFRSGETAEAEMAKAITSNTRKDALAWYKAKLVAANLTTDTGPEDRLRHLFVLLLGLGMRESSGNVLEGRDMSAHNVTAETAEAGAWQMSWDIRAGSPLIVDLFNDYKNDKDDGYFDIFNSGHRMTANYGRGNGRTFQQLCKSKPLFAAKVAGIGLRNIRTHWGPIIRRQAEVLPIANEAFEQVAKLPFLAVS